MDEDKKKQIKNLLAQITDLIEEVLDEKELVDEEAAAMGAGSVAIGAGNAFGTPKKSKKRRYIHIPEKRNKTR